MLPLSIKHTVIRTDRDPPSAPIWPASSASATRSALLILILVGRGGVLAKDAPEEPAPPQVIRINHATTTKLDALASVVDPSKVDVESRLDDAEDNRDGVRTGVIAVETADQPVDAVKGAVGAESEEVEAVDDGGDGSLAEEEQLGQHADGFQDLREHPEPLSNR